MKMIEVFISELTNILEDKKKQCEERHNILLKEECKDEANFERIKKNVYEIIPSFINASKQKVNSMDVSVQYHEFCKELELKVDNIYSIWKNKFDLAKNNGHMENMLIEEIKLSALNSVIDAIKEISQRKK